MIKTLSDQMLRYREDIEEARGIAQRGNLASFGVAMFLDDIERVAVVIDKLDAVIALHRNPEAIEIAGGEYDDPDPAWACRLRVIAAAEREFWHWLRHTYAPDTYTKATVQS